MIIEKIIDISDNRRVYFDLPPQIPAGKIRIAISILECSGPDMGPQGEGSASNDIEAFSGEEETTKFATRLSERLINEAW
jgi:hypothetical protein